MGCFADRREKRKATGFLAKRAIPGAVCDKERTVAKSKRKKEKKLKNTPQKSETAGAKSNVALKSPISESQSGGAPAKDLSSSATKNSSPAKNIAFQGVHLSTCIAGMFLCLCLGLYLGSLLPDLMNGEQKPVAGKMPPLAENNNLPRPQMPEKPGPNLIPEEAPAGMPKPAISSQLRQHVSHLEEEATKNPRDAKLLADLGNAYFDTGQTSLAIAAYEKSLAVNPANPDVLTDLGIMYREEKKYDKALECFQKAAEINPGHLNALFNQGVVLGLDMHRPEGAKAAWNKVLELSPDARTPNGKKVSDLIRQLDQEQGN